MIFELPSGNKIGAGQPPFIIAEVGSCWETFEHCKDAIGLAKNCGADAVKFQLFTPSELYGFTEDITPGINPYLQHGWLIGLKEKADAFDIELMCSAFSPEGVKYVDQFVNIHKLASSENTHVRMLSVLRETKKPVVISGGASGSADMAKSICELNGHDWRSATFAPKVKEGRPITNTRAIPLHCVSDYPARCVDLKQIEVLKDRYGVAGFSDHTTDVLEIPFSASRNYGACVIEKHVNFFGVQCPDSPHSLSREEFRQMCAKLKGKEYSESGQKEMYLKHNRRIIATKTIAQGEVMQEGLNIGIYRSRIEDTHGFSPFRIDEIQGKMAKHLIKAGDSIGPGDV